MVALKQKSPMPIEVVDQTLAPESIVVHAGATALHVLDVPRGDNGLVDDNDVKQELTNAFPSYRRNLGLSAPGQTSTSTDPKTNPWQEVDRNLSLPSLHDVPQLAARASLGRRNLNKR